MKKLKDMFTVIRIQTLSEVNLGPWTLEAVHRSLLTKEILNSSHLKSLYFILW